MKNNILSLIFVGAAVVSCAHNYDQIRPTPVTGDSNMCAVASAHLSQLCEQDPVKNKYCCDVNAPTLKVKTFTQFCIEKQYQGVALNPGCIANVVYCEQIDICTNSK